jgi:tetratricopeptide (TPR) repeat protein
VAFSQKRGAKVDPKMDAAAKISAGDAFVREGNGGKAITSYEEAASLSPQDPVPHFKIGSIYLRSGNKEAAMEEFQKATNADANYAQSYKEIAELYYIQKDGAQAVKAQEKFLELSTDASEKDLGHVRLGYYFFMTRDFAKANEAFALAKDRALLKDNDFRYYGLSLVEAGDYERGRKIFEEYFSKRPGAGAADYAAYGKALVLLDQDSLAIAVLEKSLALDNKQTAVKKMLWESLYNLGKEYYSKKDFVMADTTFEKLINLHPGIVTGYLWAGRANAQLDPESEKGLAKDFYEKVIGISKSGSDLKEAYSYLGYYYYVQKNSAQSRENWEKVLTIDPQDERAKEALRLFRP